MIVELINFAHGDLSMIGSFVSFALYGSLGLTLTTGPLGLAFGVLATLAVAMAACSSLNVLIERVAYRPLRGSPRLARLITAVGGPLSAVSGGHRSDTAMAHPRLRR